MLNRSVGWRRYVQALHAADAVFPQLLARVLRVCYQGRHVSRAHVTKSETRLPEAHRVRLVSPSDGHGPLPQPLPARGTLAGVSVCLSVVRVPACLLVSV